MSADTLNATPSTHQERAAQVRQQETDEAVRRYLQGESIRQIAKALGRGYRTVHNRLTAAQVTMRPVGGARGAR